MKVVFHLSFFFIVGLLLSCSSSQKAHNGAIKSNNHGLQTASYENHSGRYEHCSLCQRVRMNQESATAQLKNELPEVRIEGYENVLTLNKESFLDKNYVLSEKKVIPRKNHQKHWDEPLKTATKITSVNKNHSIQNDDGIANSNDVKPKTEIFGVIGFILGLAGLFLAIAPYFSIPVFSLGSILIAFGLSGLGVVFGTISWVKVDNNPHLYKGKGFALASLFLGYLGWSFFLANLTIYSLALIFGP